jgi:thioredoxin 1
MEFEVTQENFEDKVLKSEVPVIVDFWAEWCTPCKMVEPVLDEIAGEYEGRLAVGRLNVDEQADLASQYSIVSIPSLILFKNGEEVTQHIGAAPKETIVEFFENHLD